VAHRFDLPLDLMGRVVAAADATTTAMVLVDGGGVRWHNAAATRLVEPYGGRWDGPDGPVELLAGVRDEPVCLRWPTPDGSVRWWRATRQDLADGRLIQLVDETEHDGGPITAVPGTATWDWDVVADRARWSPELPAMLGLPADVVIDRQLLAALVHPDDMEGLERTLTDALRSGESWGRTVRFFRSDRADLRTVELRGSVVLDAATARPLRLLGTARDVTEMQATRTALAFLAANDPHTGVASRHRVLTELAECAAGAGGTVVVIDVDKLTEINEVHGVTTGDEVLRELAGLLLREAGGEVLLGRIGGDRFTVVLPEHSVAEALAASARLCAMVARTPIPAGGGLIKVAVSAGVAEIVRDVDTTLFHAGLALDEAKRTGGGRAVSYTEDLQRTAGRRVNLLRRVAAALDDGAMALHAQPIIDLRTRRVSRYELLLRLCDGKEPPLGPAEFLPPVERTDLVHRLDRWVVGEAVRALATPRARATGLRLQANLSGRSLEDRDLGAWILEQLRRHDVLPDRLGVEVTETVAITELTAARDLASTLIDAGVGFALDDFGAGFGSFAYLKHLRFTSVKIAGDFVAQVDQSATDRALVGAVVALARPLGLVTVAEQVDRPQLVVELRRIGVDQGQGYHLGRPAPLTALIQGSEAELPA